MPRLPKIKGLLSKKKKEEKAPTPEEAESILRRQIEEMARERLSGYIATGIPRGYKIIKRYPLEDPWSHAVIVENPETKDRRYIVDEIPLSRDEKELYDKLMDILYWELEPPPPGVDYQEHFQREAKRVISRYQLRLGLLPGVSWAKILYYIIRDTIGFGVIDPLFKDPYVEDISCDGLNRPIFVWHREFESIPSNIVFTDE
ncbi:MAG: hypothetical protein F7C32_03315 [Desulfurococcales archaeon]|nr:hypothetical protein [Desulfurococcales archaeon]